MSNEPSDFPGTKRRRGPLDRWIGPPSAFLKMLGATFFLLLNGYFRVLDDGEGLLELISAFVLRSILLGSLLAGAGLYFIGLVDLLRTNNQDRFLGFLMFVIGILVIDAMEKLALTEPSAYLQAFVATMATVVVAAAVWARRFAKTPNAA